MKPSSEDVAGVVAPPPLLYAGGLALGLGMHGFHPHPVLPVPASRVVGPLLVAVGLIHFVGAVLALYRARTSPKPWRPTTAIVVTGPYRWTRNPIYLGFTLLYLGVTAWVNTIWPLIPFPVVLLVMQRGVIAREEAYLEKKFGEEYRQYKSKVRRWLG